MTSITIKGVNENVYRRFKALAALRGISIQKAIEEAMILWIKQSSVSIEVEDVEGLIEYLRSNPAKPFVKKKIKEGVKEWAERKLGLRR